MSALDGRFNRSSLKLRIDVRELRNLVNYPDWIAHVQLAGLQNRTA
jgi:hypothetical protein